MRPWLPEPSEDDRPDDDPELDEESLEDEDDDPEDDELDDEDDDSEEDDLCLSLTPPIFFTFLLHQKKRACEDNELHATKTNF